MRPDDNRYLFQIIDIFARGEMVPLACFSAIDYIALDKRSKK